MEKWMAGIDIGGTSVKLAFFNMEGEIQQKWEIPTNKADGGNQIIRDIAASVASKLEELGLPKEKVVSAGAGAPGPIDAENGLLFEAVNLGWGDRYPLRDLLAEALGVPVAIDNDANCAALGEMWRGAGLGAKDLFAITLGTGVGGGVIVNGNIAHGARGAAGEIGHITSVLENGYLCNCGKEGCLETVASATGVVRTAVDLIGASDEASELRESFEKTGVISAKDIFDAAERNDALAKKAVDRLAKYLGLALANAAAVTNPEKIVIGGGVSKAGDLLMEPVRSYFKAYAFKPIAEYTEIVTAQLGNDAGIIGAAWLAKNRFNG